MSNLKVGTITHTSDSNSYVITVTNDTIGEGNYLDIGVGTKESHTTVMQINSDSTVSVNKKNLIDCKGITGSADSATKDGSGNNINSYYLGVSEFEDVLTDILARIPLKKYEIPPKPYDPWVTSGAQDDN